GLAARAVQVSDDGLAYRFLLRRGIKFHDGSPLTAHDVAFSLKTLKDKGHPVARILLRDFTVAEVVDDTTVVVRFAVNKARDAPLLAATLPIFSRAYYADRPFDESTLDVPLGSGPYKVDASKSDGSSSTSGSPTGGGPTCRSCAGRTISISSVM